MAFTRLNLIIIKNCVCIIVHIQWVHRILYESTLFCQCVSKCLRFSEHSVVLLMNPSAVCSQSLTSLLEASWPCLLVFAFPQGELGEQKQQQYWLVLLHFSFVSHSFRLIRSGNLFGLEAERFGELFWCVHIFFPFSQWHNLLFVFTLIFDIYFLCCHFWKRNTEGKQPFFPISQELHKETLKIFLFDFISNLFCYTKRIYISHSQMKRFRVVQWLLKIKWFPTGLPLCYRKKKPQPSP